MKGSKTFQDPARFLMQAPRCKSNEGSPQKVPHDSSPLDQLIHVGKELYHIFLVQGLL